MNLSELRKKLYDKEITYIDYLKSSKEYQDFTNWCNAHGVTPDEENAEFYYDMTHPMEMADSEVYMEIYP